MYKYLLMSLTLFVVSGCRTAYYQNDLIITPQNEENRKIISNDIEKIYHNTCRDNNFELISEACPESPFYVYSKDKVYVFYNPRKIELFIRSYKKQRVFEMSKLFHDILKGNKDINIKMEESMYYGSRFF